MSTKLETDRQAAVVRATSVKLIPIQVFVYVKLITWARLEVYRWVEVQWCWIEVRVTFTPLPLYFRGWKCLLVSAEQEVGWSGPTVVHHAVTTD